MKSLLLFFVLITLASTQSDENRNAERGENVTAEAFEIKNDPPPPPPLSGTKPSRFIDKVRAIGRKQAIGVKGKLMCAGQPVKNATIKLWDNDMFDPDDLISETQANADGTFLLSGFVVSITAIDPQIRIYHNCRSTSKVCRRKITFTVPENYINKGTQVNKWFDLGTPNMEIGVKHKEEPYCY